MKIPQMFYLRKIVMGRKTARVVLYVYWNYRKTQCGTLHVTQRDDAKRMLSHINPEAEFWR